MGFTEGFMRSQAFTQKTQGKCTIAKITVATGGFWLAVLSSYMTDIKKKKLLTLLCFDRLAKENQVDPVGSSSCWYLWLVKNPVSLG